MSRTNRKTPFSVFRHPKGKKRALIGGARKGAVPPDAWEDKPFSGEVWKAERRKRKTELEGGAGCDNCGKGYSSSEHGADCACGGVVSTAFK
jgi:hypothetical protein